MTMSLFTSALVQADKVRMDLGLDMYQPVNIFDAAADLGLVVRFLNINMEGMYINQENRSSPTIFLSNQRPLPRRSFTCAHELGHHIFKHGSKIDALSDNPIYSQMNDVQEHLVDAFAGALLMPVAGIMAEFAMRNLKAEDASPIQFFMLSSVFGTGYQTLVIHCKMNKIINEAKEKELLKYTPAKILKSTFGTAVNSHFKIIDGFTELSVIDLEVSNYIILPPKIKIEGDHLQKYRETSLGTGYIAMRPGIIRVTTRDNSFHSFIRIQNANYVGLSEYRHLENLD
jgi:hypothetical protein